LGLLLEGVEGFYARSSQATHGDFVIALAAVRNQPSVVEHLTVAAPLALKKLLHLQDTVNSALGFGLDSDPADSKAELQRVRARPSPEPFCGAGGGS
jgi:hypothetical protein